MNAALDDLVRHGIREPAVLAAIAAVPRAPFVAAGQATPPMTLVAVVVRGLALRPADRVLLLGAETGYTAAVVSTLAARVDAVVAPEHAAAVGERLAVLGYTNVAIHAGEPGLGWPAGEPYDAIAFVAGSPRIAPVVVSQLADGGRFVAVIGEPGSQRVVRVTRDPGGATTETLALVERSS